MLKAQNLQDWLADLENRYIEEIQLGLKRVRQVAKKLSLNCLDIPVITVAGTNGKGSTVAMLEALYTLGGYRVGAYTSPHLVSFTERIRIHRHPVDEEVLCDAFAKIEAARGQVALTYFEFATLAALLVFKNNQLDVVILEVGMGGRLDATNVVDADLSLITTIDYDHQAYLGDTLEAIAYEKAGVMRAGQPCIYADEVPFSSMVQHAKQLGAKLICAGMDYVFLTDPDTTFRSQTSYLEIQNLNGDRVQLPWPQLHPRFSVAAVMACELLGSRLPVSDAVVHQAFLETTIPGRLEYYFRKVGVVLDVAHNPQSIRRLAQFIRSLSPEKKVFAVFSVLKDKDIVEMIKPLAPLVTHWNIAPVESKRATLVGDLAEIISQIAPAKISMFQKIPDAYLGAEQEAEEGDLIVVFGSFLVVGSVINLLNSVKEESA